RIFFFLKPRLFLLFFFFMKRHYSKWKHQGLHANEALIKKRGKKRKGKKEKTKGEMMTVDS
uniref:hypothetical protein n=1 Tax=Thiolapillus sp. TaxID=2017437 RepID=UPI003AF56B45